MFDKEDGSGITFWDMVGYGWDLLAKWAWAVVRWGVGAVDMIWDGYANIADVATNTAADLTGIQWLRTNISEKEWIIDKVWKPVYKWIDEWNKLTDSELWKTNEWQLGVDIIKTLWEFVAPGWVAKKAGAATKIPKALSSLVEKLKGIPKAMDEIKLAMARGNKIDKSYLTEVANRYGWDTKAILNFDDLKGFNADELTTAQSAMKAIDEGKSVNSIPWFHELPEKLKTHVYNFSEWKWGMTKEYVPSARRVAKESQMDDITWKYNAPDGWISIADDITDINKSVGKYNQKFDNATPDANYDMSTFKSRLESASPEVKQSLIKKYPTLAKIIIWWGWITAALWIYWAMRDDEKKELKKDIAGSEVNMSKPGVDGSITIPTTDPSVNMSKTPEVNMSKPADPASIAAKKQEIELLKEKNKSTLNMGTSVVDLMKGLGLDSSDTARKIAFEKITGKPYQRTAEQNIQLYALVEEALSTGKNLELFTPIKR